MRIVSAVEIAPDGVFAVAGVAIVSGCCCVGHADRKISLNDGAIGGSPFLAFPIYWKLLKRLRWLRFRDSRSV